MLKYVYVCDRCGKETPDPVRIYGYEVNTKTDDEIPSEHPARNELCPDCFKKLVSFISNPKDEEPKMEEIAEHMDFPIVTISRVISQEGLGEERYAGKPIPSAGSLEPKLVNVYTQNERNSWAN